MNILVTGASGFIGRHLVVALLNKGHSVTALGRNVKKAQSMPWWDDVDFVRCDIHKINSFTKILGDSEIMVHLAWAGLPDYSSLHHFEINLPNDYKFIRSMLDIGLQRVLITGTCFEYGMRSGALTEEMSTFPVTPYGLAKDCLCKFLQELQNEIEFNLQWVRLFYTYGPFQNANSLLAQLDKAIEDGAQIFNMSGGEQLRDYLPIEDVAIRLVSLIEQPECTGIVNCCKGIPISVRRLVEQHLKSRGADIALNFGYYPYPDYEPMAFWGDCSKFAGCLVP